MKLTIDAKPLLKGLDLFSSKTNAIVRDALWGASGEMENESKNLAPWTDRTGNARHSIQGSEPEITKSGGRAYLSIGVYYGVYLELAHGGKYRTVWPTLEWEASRLPLWVQKSYEKNL